MKRIILLCFLMTLSCKKKQDDIVLSKLPGYFNSKIKKGLSKDSLKIYLEQVKRIPKQNLSDSLKAEFFYVLAKFNNRLKEYDLAIENLNYATSFSENKIKSNREVLFFRALMGTYYSYKNDYLNGEGVNEKLHSLLDKKDYKNRAYVYGFRENVKAALGQFEEALVANDSSAVMFLRAGDTTNYTIAKIGRSSIYSSLGKQKQAINELTEAIKYESTLSITGRYQLYGTLGFYFFNTKSYRKAIRSYKKSLLISKHLSYSLVKTRVVNNYINLSKSYLELKEYSIAKKYVDSIFQLGLKNIDYINQKEALRINLEVTYKEKEEIGEVMSQLGSIFSYQEKNYADRIVNELKVLKESHENEIVLEKAKKKAEIQSLKLERNQYVLILLLLIAITTGFLIFNFYRQRKFKMEQQHFLLHQRLLRSQLNPHFIFNSLSLIKNNIEEDKDKSIKYLQKFSRLLRAIFENSTKDYVPIEDELESLQDYIELQQFRFPDRFIFSLNNTIKIEEEIFIPPMLLQPFVENSIIHGFGKSERRGKLKIKLRKRGNYISCIIDDDGIGVDENNVNKRSSVKLIDEFLKKMTGKGIIMINKKELSQESRGTKVELKIPYTLI